MRLFIAAPLPHDVAAAAAAVLPDLPGVRRVSPELMHVTVAFLGSLGPDRLPDVFGGLREGCAGRPGFDVSLGALGRFPAEGEPRIVWVGIDRGAAELIRIAEGVRRALAARGVPFDEKPFRAHVTLARVTERADRSTTRALASFIERARPPALGYRATEIVCFESVVTSKGPRYTPRATLALDAGGRAGPTRA